jgi:hypothetical protein
VAELHFRRPELYPLERLVHEGNERGWTVVVLLGIPVYALMERRRVRSLGM